MTPFPDEPFSAHPTGVRQAAPPADPPGDHRSRTREIELSLDDFGTGHSSLSHIRRLPVNELKIDRSFVSAMLTDEADESIVRSAIQLGRELGLRTVAEGVEDEDTLARLSSLGCDVAQGFLFSQALSPDDFLTWLRAWSPDTVGAHAAGPPAASP